MKIIHQWRVVLLVIAILSLAVEPVRAFAAESTLFRVGYGGVAGYQLPLWVNKEAGIAKKYGIDLEILLIGAGSLSMQALLAGSIQMSQSSASSMMGAALKGVPVVIIATSENKMPFQIVARPEIKNPQQLRGKKIGIQRFGGSNDIIIQWALKAWKIDPHEVTFLQAGATIARLTALSRGHVDATILSYPEIFNARKLGMTVLADVGDFSSYPNTSLTVTRSFLEKNRPLVKTLLKAQIDAIHYIKTNKEGSLRVLSKYLKVTDPEMIEATYDFFSRRTVVLPRTDSEGMKSILKEMGTPQKNPSEFLDMSLVDEIEREGFIQKLYGS